MVKIIIAECEGVSEKVWVHNVDLNFDNVKNVVNKSVHTLYLASRNGTERNLIDYIKEHYENAYNDMIASGVFTDASIVYAIEETAKVTKEKWVDAIDRLFGQIEGDDDVFRSRASLIMVSLATKYKDKK